MAIFMIGTQRSGSNLLRLMLNQLPDVAAPHPPHILQRMTSVLPAYGDLDKEQNFLLLINDVCRLVELNPVPWQGVNLDREAIAARCRTRSLMGVYEAVYDTVAEAWGAKTWCCKSLNNIKFLPGIETHFDQAKYIYLYRDGRDVAVSFRKAIVGEKHFYHIAREWGRTQRLALAMEGNIGPERFFSTSYEELVNNPEQVMRRMCGFLELPYSDSMLDFFRSEEAIRAAKLSKLWGDVAKPVNSGNTGKFLSEATKKDIRIFESVAGDVLDSLGYERCFVAKGEEEHYRPEDIQRFDEENEHMIEEVKRNSDPADLERRDRQANLVLSIIARQQLVSDEWLSRL